MVLEFGIWNLEFGIWNLPRRDSFPGESFGLEEF